MGKRIVTNDSFAVSSYTTWLALLRSRRPYGLRSYWFRSQCSFCQVRSPSPFPPSRAPYSLPLLTRQRKPPTDAQKVGSYRAPKTAGKQSNGTTKHSVSATRLIFRARMSRMGFRCRCSVIVRRGRFSVRDMLVCLGRALDSGVT